MRFYEKYLTGLEASLQDDIYLAILGTRMSYLFGVVYMTNHKIDITHIIGAKYRGVYRQFHSPEEPTARDVQSCVF